MKLIDRCLLDNTLDPDAMSDDEIYAWHSDSDNRLDLHEHLGMTWNEWNAYVENRLSLKQIVEFRRTRLS